MVWSRFSRQPHGEWRSLRYASIHRRPSDFAAGISGTRAFPDEWAARQQLAACYRIFALLGWTEMIYNHITLRVPESASGDEKQFLINPFGLHYSEVTASNLVKVNLAGEILSDSSHPINPAGFVLHSCIHDGVPGAHCVMHTHTTAGVAVASLASGLS
ncbi:hypothetical protein FBQ96_14920, partial [Nitrospirales bacterium NOB]|nr:hypothetical protein [Nitrospirales bacterium NOB]